MTQQEIALKTWENIGGYFGRDGDTFRKVHGDELQKAGITFHQVIKINGKKVRVVSAFPVDLRVWASLKAKKGETI